MSDGIAGFHTGGPSQNGDEGSASRLQRKPERLEEDAPLLIGAAEDGDRLGFRWKRHGAAGSPVGPDDEEPTQGTIHRPRRVSGHSTLNGPDVR